MEKINSKKNSIQMKYLPWQCKKLINEEEDSVL